MTYVETLKCMLDNFTARCSNEKLYSFSSRETLKWLMKQALEII